RSGTTTVTGVKVATWLHTVSTEISGSADSPETGPRAAWGTGPWEGPSTRGCTGCAKKCSSVRPHGWTRVGAKCWTWAAAPASTYASGAVWVRARSPDVTLPTLAWSDCASVFPSTVSPARTPRTWTLGRPVPSTWSPAWTSSSTSPMTLVMSVRWRSSPEYWDRGEG